MSNCFKNLIVLLLSIALSILILEIFLRIYNPFPFRLVGDKISLPTNVTYYIKNSSVFGLDEEITHTKNSLGFRGPEIPEDFDKYLSIIAVGGSTTECYYLSDNQTWPYLLDEKLSNNFDNIWINNAGLDGHSTLGHKILLQDYVIKIKPKIILFFIGLNDICVDDSELCSRFYPASSDISRLKNYLAQKSEIANVLVNVIRVVKAQKLGVVHKSINLFDSEKMEISEADMLVKLSEYSKNINDFEYRIKDLVKISRENNIDPVLITQPMLWGNGSDLATGINLENIKIDNEKNGKLYWDILQLYNDKLRQLGIEESILVIDLAEKMPKNSLFYYDGIHYSNEGSALVAETIATDLVKYFKENFQNNIRNK